ncbi:MAG: hypothetical protein AAGK78_04935, partial [Planctomycetota bacterium]
MRKRPWCPTFLAACVTLAGSVALAQNAAGSDADDFGVWAQRLSADLYQDRVDAEDELLAAALSDPALALVVREQA